MNIVGVVAILKNVGTTTSTIAVATTNTVAAAATATAATATAAGVNGITVAEADIGVIDMEIRGEMKKVRNLDQRWEILQLKR
eukprot:ANDGO_03986.mRNA.1 hypothetical protein